MFRLILGLYLLCAPTGVYAEDFSVSGHGAPRQGYFSCQNDLSSFENKLRATGLELESKVSCTSITGQSEAYAPFFTAKSKIKITVETLIGAQFSSLTYCEIERMRLISEASSKKSKIFESTCERIRAPNYKNDFDELYQPELILFTKI